MKTITTLTLLLFITLINLTNVSAQFQNPKKGGGKPDSQLSQKDNDYLDRQAKVFLDTIQSILSENKPGYPENRERGTAKLLLDAVFHEHYAELKASKYPVVALIWGESYHYNSIIESPNKQIINMQTVHY